MAKIIDPSVEPVKIYFRSSSKYAKIAYFHPHISTDELYIFASRTCEVPANRLHLFLHGSLLQSSSKVELEPGAIVHIVRLDELKKETITIMVKRIEGDTQVHRVELDANTLVRRFVDDRLKSLYSNSASQMILVHMGRQLGLDHTFKQEEVEDGSEILCLTLQEPDSVPTMQNAQSQSENGCDYEVRIPIISELETPEAPKDIYPTNDFVIGVPQGIEASNSLNLIFDSKVRRSSSIRNIDLDPSEIIAQQDSLLDPTNRNKQCQSEHQEQDRQKQSHFSQEWNRTEKGNLFDQYQEEPQKVNVLEGNLQSVQFKAGDLIYAGDFHMLPENNIMGNFIQGFLQKAGRNHS